MQFLDAIGLASFWEKIKNWAHSSFFSKRGGEIHPEIGLQYTINGEQLSITKSGEENETISIFNVDENRMEAIAIVKSGGTATQVLMADGSVKTLNASNGIAGLDSKGNVPLSQLGNLDTTVAEVVTALPTANIKKHIYLIKDASGVTQNQYEEYIYTGDTSATYDASKWEKLGDFRATVDLADYAKKSEAIDRLIVETQPTGVHSERQFISIYKAGNSASETEVEMLEATTNMSGFMSAEDKSKLDNIEHYANNYSLPLAANSTRGGIQLGYTANGRNYPVQLSGEKAYVNVPWTDTNTTYDLSPYAKKVETVNFSSIRMNKLPNNTSHGPIYKQIISFNSLDGNKSVDIELEEAAFDTPGLMSTRDKNKLDSISSGATADSAIPISVIDALN